MSFDLKEIAEAWIIAISPTPEQKKLAEARYSTCLGCEYYREKRKLTGDPYCVECGCPLNKKIFSKKENPCPKRKWEDADRLYYKDTQKKTRSLL